MSTIKYTDDGKKVLVVGKLNAEQTIVQEIFVSAGQEIPSGENFVVKSLHDQPAESWKAKNLRELEERYDKERKRLELEIGQQQKRLSLEKAKAKVLADTLMQFVKAADESQLETLKSFMAGEITHVFIDGYSPEIVDWLDSSAPYDVDSWHGNVKLEGIKLVSLMGRSDGSLDYRLHQYRDGSGSSKSIYPALSYQEALAMAQASLDKQCASYLEGSLRGINLNDWEKIDGIVIPSAVREKFKAEVDEGKRQRIAQLKKQLAELEAQDE